MTVSAISPLPSTTDMSFFSTSPRSTAGSPYTSRTVHVQTKHVKSSPPPTPPLFPVSSSSRSSPEPTSPRKRKSPSMEARPSSAPVEHAFRTTKKARIKNRDSECSSRASSRGFGRHELPPSSPEPVFRSASSRSTSTPQTSPDLPSSPSTRIWTSNEDGDPGTDFVSSEKVVIELMRSYKAYFRNPNDPDDRTWQPHPTQPPSVILEYPNNHAEERFILLAPKDKDHYNPIMDLEATLYTIAEFYLPERYKALFGDIPSTSLLDGSPSPPTTRSSSPRPPSSQRSVSSSALESDYHDGDQDEDLPAPAPLLRHIQRAIHTRDGPLFVQTMAEINYRLRLVKYPKCPVNPCTPLPQNRMIERIPTWTDKNGIPKKVLMRIIEENYQRCVGPKVPRLRQYQAFTSTVYGELMPSLVYDIVTRFKLTENSLFLDLGSGVGNVLVQASLQTGCKSYGIELMDHPADVASDMLRQFRIRCRMWGVTAGDIELEKGDMLHSARVDELIKQADLILVDNKVFEESLNEQLRPKFLDMKEDAVVVSLVPFVPSINARFTERNVDSITSIFAVSEHQYHPGSVSWGNGSGVYYEHRIDRTGYAEAKERFEKNRRSRSIY